MDVIYFVPVYTSACHMEKRKTYNGSGPSFSKSDYANPRLALILIAIHSPIKEGFPIIEAQ